MSQFQMDGKWIFIAGGSRGLGKELALQLAAKGANVVILARNQQALDHAKTDILKTRRTETQVVDTISLDLAIPEAVDAALEKYNVVPDILFCVSGGSNSEQLGFLTDMEPHGIKSCMESNYYSAVFITRAVLRLWLKSPVVDYTRHIVFTASTAAFVALPGYVAYTPPKVAVRALADTLRQELLLYGGKDKYQVHCSFPGTFTSEAFLAEAETKPKLTMILEGSDMTEEQLKKTKQSSAEVAQLVIKGLERGEFFITVDFEGELLLNNMRGPSPRHRPVYDFFLGFVAVIVWFFVRRDFDKKIAKFGLKEKLRN